MNSSKKQTPRRIKVWRTIIGYFLVYYYFLFSTCAYAGKGILQELFNNDPAEPNSNVTSVIKSRTIIVPEENNLTGATNIEENDSSFRSIAGKALSWIQEIALNRCENFGQWLASQAKEIPPSYFAKSFLEVDYAHDDLFWQGHFNQILSDLKQEPFLSLQGLKKLEDAQEIVWSGLLSPHAYEEELEQLGKKGRFSRAQGLRLAFRINLIENPSLTIQCLKKDFLKYLEHTQYSVPPSPKALHAHYNYNLEQILPYYSKILNPYDFKTTIELIKTALEKHKDTLRLSELRYKNILETLTGAIQETNQEQYDKIKKERQIVYSLLDETLQKSLGTSHLQETIIPLEREGRKPSTILSYSHFLGKQLFVALQKGINFTVENPLQAITMGLAFQTAAVVAQSAFKAPGFTNEVLQKDLEKVENFIYSDGNNIYLPQQSWLTDGSPITFNAKDTNHRLLSFASGAQLPKGGLSEGLYQLLSIENTATNHIEIWKNLKKDLNLNVSITTPIGISAIPGMGALVPHKVPSVKANDELLDLQGNITFQADHIQSIQTQYPDADNVVVVGMSGHGKTSLIHGIAGVALDAQPDEIGKLRLYPRSILQGFNVGHGIHVGTSIPSAWYDDKVNVLYWDCPGFGDPGGATEDILHAFSRKKLFQNKNNLKIVLVINEATLEEDRPVPFFNLLNDMAALFPEDDKLQKNLALVITKTDGQVLPYKRIQNIYGQVFRPGKVVLNEKGKKFIEFLADKNNEDRICSFPKPTIAGTYLFPKQKILNCLNSVKYVKEPEVDFKAGIGATAKLRVKEFSELLNHYLTNYMDTQGAQEIVNYCRQLIDDPSKLLSELKNNFKDLIRDLEKLQKTNTNAKEFINLLKDKFDTKEINSNINFIDFLKEIDITVTYNTDSWSNALFRQVKDKIVNLNKSPEATESDGVLTIKGGTLIGTSDVNEAIKAASKALQSINVYGLNTLWIDQDITANGVSLKFLAPRWRVIGERKIDLSGVSGTHGGDGTHGVGGDGQPGGPGGNGGYFYGKGFIFEGHDKLMVNGNGGSGGSGGNAGNGANGIDGLHGNCELISRKEGNTWYYNHQGTDGTAGHDSGQRGHGGKGGYGGSYAVDYDHGSWKDSFESGTDGSHGNPGVAGKGGTHGQHCQGTLFTGRTAEVLAQDRVVKTPFGEQTDVSTDVWYRIKCKHNNKVLNAVGDHHMAVDVSAFIDDTPDHSHRLWTLVPTSTPGYYRIKCKHNNKVLNAVGDHHMAVDVSAFIDDTPDHSHRLWSFIPVSGTRLKTISIADKWLVAKGHQGARGKAPDGNIIQALNTKNLRNPSTALSFNPLAIVEEYSRYYSTKATDRNLNPFIKVFPNLPELIKNKEEKTEL